MVCKHAGTHGFLGPSCVLSNMVWSPVIGFHTRTDDLYDILPPHDLDISRQTYSRSCKIWLMLKDGTRRICMISHMFPRLDPYYADPAQPLTSAGEEPDYLDCDMSDLPVRRAIDCTPTIPYQRF